MRAPNFNPLTICKILALFLLVRAQPFGLNTDGLLLLSFKYSITTDPYGVLESWNYDDENPCSWNGVVCDAYFRVTGLSLPDAGLSGSIPATLGTIQHLRDLNLSNNSINGSIPITLFSALQLQTVDLCNNRISGALPELVGNLQNLQSLNLSDNALIGKIPLNLTSLRNLTAVSLKNNYFTGLIPGGFESVRILDLSSNLIYGSLPLDFGGDHISYLNVSFNRISGGIPPEFGAKIPDNATVDFSFNNLSGHVPAESGPLLFNTSFSGNPELCGKPLKTLCPIPSSPPAIAVIPRNMNSPPGKRTGLKTGTILGIVMGIGMVAFGGVMYVCMLAKKRRGREKKKKAESAKELDWASSESSSSSSSDEYSWLRTWTCLKKARQAADDVDDDRRSSSQEQKDGGALVTVDGEKELELEALLKASAFIMGASGSSIMYKAVLQDGSTFAVRRIGENGVDRFKDFDNQIRVIAKLVHPNLVPIRGFYWGSQEKLIIYDFVPNGSLANARYRKAGSSSPCPLPWEVRLKIAKGVARGLSYIHEKKHVHGNLKPSNIVLGLDMEPKIGDFGLERLVAGDTSSKAVGSARNFGSMRSTDSFQDLATPSPSSSVIGLSPYHAPESLRSLKPHPKWDVFSFGVVLLELLTGKVIVSDETASTCTDEYNKSKILKMADVGIRADMEGKEEALLALLKLGYSCISPVPQKRPSMKEVLQTLQRFPPTCSFS